MRLSLKELLISHINYRDVFNAPVKISSLMKWVGALNNSELETMVLAHLNSLEYEHLIERKGDYVTVSGKGHLIDIQEEKRDLTHQLIKKGKKTLGLIGKLPFIRYIGVSGAVAAENPTIDQSGHVDLDLFVITSKNTLWVQFFTERIITNIIRFIKGNHFYCFNYVTDESFLEVYNKNFFTATEIVNLKTIVDDGIFSDFIAANKWHESYYAEGLKPAQESLKKRSSLISMIIWPFNYLFFILFCVARGIKKGNPKLLIEFLTKFNPVQKCNLNRISNPNGGYQQAIKSRFEELFKNNFENYYSPGVIAELFPKHSNFLSSHNSKAYDKQVKNYFSKYILPTIDEKSTV